MKVVYINLCIIELVWFVGEVVYICFDVDVYFFVVLFCEMDCVDLIDEGVFEVYGCGWKEFLVFVLVYGVEKVVLVIGMLVDMIKGLV